MSAKLLGEAKGLPAMEREELFLAGLLHDLGKVVLELLKEQNPNLGFLLQSLDSAKLGSVLLRQWKILNLPCSNPIRVF